MGTTNVRLILGVLALLAMPLVAIAAPAGNGNGQPIVLNFEPTVMLLSTPNGTHPSGNGLGVPEPTTLALAGLGLPLIGAGRWLRRKKA